MRKVLAVFCGAVLILPVLTAPAIADPVADAVARDLGISASAARTRLVQQERAHDVSAGLSVADAGRWFDAASGRLTVAVTRPEDADLVRAAGASAVLVSRSAAELSALVSRVKASGHAFRSVGVDVRRNDVVVSAVGPFPAVDGVRVVRVAQPFVQQSGEVNPGDPWWPGSESNCSVGFPATDSSGGKHFVTAGHCTNDASQAAYGESGQRNRLGTSNVGGNRSVNAREGDMGVVAVTEPGWTVSPVVNTWGSPAVTVTGSKDALVGEAVCHSGNTAPQFECGVVNSVNQTVDYGSVVVDGLSLTTACSEGGDSGGAWLAGSSAVGLHSGGQSSCSPGSTEDNSIFQPVNEALAKWNLTLVTGSGSGDTEPPTAPSGLRSTGATATGVSLEWSAASDNVGVTGYDVYSGSTVVASVAGPSASVDGLTPDTAYSFTVAARDAAGNVSKQSDAVSVRTAPGSGSRTFGNPEDFPIRDFQVAVSRVVSTASGAAASSVTVQVDATHTCSQDLNIALVGPSGRSYSLQRYGGYPCTPLQPKAFTARVSERAAGTWTLRIGDNGPADEGVLSGWSITV
ncbi:proprotein convertase P-domain-containing protein [Lentzea aerocolonigenes]|uniref:proprotein convertase P-domain-containing protein n=1 Tax=Lentzea aerocolonigenes TaxID=68170 RepID=UPI0005ECBB22|nr:proprotein convertase P-domain-containing protein [Lentzea aerocolonigenes]